MNDEANDILVLVNVNNKFEDGLGNIFPSSGEVEFVPDGNDTAKGFFGILWGRLTFSNSLLEINKNSNWLVVQVPEDKNVVFLDRQTNLIKFTKGEVVHCGTIRSCAEYIITNKDRAGSFFGDRKGLKPYQIAGSELHSTSFDPAVTSGYLGRAISRVGNIPAISCGEEGLASAHEIYADALSTGPDSRAISSGYGGTSVATGNNSRSRCSENGVAVSSGAMASAIADGKNGVAICTEPGSIGSVSQGGTLIMAYEKNGERRFAIGYEGENISADTLYCCEGGQFISLDSVEDISCDKGISDTEDDMAHVGGLNDERNQVSDAEGADSGT